MTRRTFRNALRGLSKVLERHSGCADSVGRIRDMEEWHEAVCDLLTLDGDDFVCDPSDTETIDLYVDHMWLTYTDTLIATWPERGE